MASIDQFEEFQRLVRRHIERGKWADPPFQSSHWFLLKYLKRIETDAGQSDSPTQIDNCIRAMLRFYVDSIDTDSELGDICREIFEAHGRSLREETPPQ